MNLDLPETDESHLTFSNTEGYKHVLSTLIHKCLKLHASAIFVIKNTYRLTHRKKCIKNIFKIHTKYNYGLVSIFDIIFKWLTRSGLHAVI